MGSEMDEPKCKDVQEAEAALKERAQEKYILRLYVAGITPNSLRAIDNIKEICEEHLQGRYELEVIDLYQQPVLAQGEQIIAAPTLIKKLPLPLAQDHRRYDQCGAGAGGARFKTQR